MYDDVPAEPPPGAYVMIRPVLMWDQLLGESLLCLWAVTGVVGLLYLAVRGRRRDPVLHYSLFTGIGLTGALVLIVVLAVLGAAGPPFIMGSAILGVGAGIRIAQHAEPFDLHLDDIAALVFCLSHNKGDDITLAHQRAKFKQFCTHSVPILYPADLSLTPTSPSCTHRQP